MANGLQYTYIELLTLLRVLWTSAGSSQPQEEEEEEEEEEECVVLSIFL